MAEILGIQTFGRMLIIAVGANPKNPIVAEDPKDIGTPGSIGTMAICENGDGVFYKTGDGNEQWSKLRFE